MTVTIHETYRSGGGTEGPDAQAELKYCVQGTKDDAVVRGMVEGEIPAIYAGLIFDSYDFEPLGNKKWEVSVRYGRKESTYNFDTGGGTAHITQSRLTRNRYPAPGEIAANYFGAIGVNGDTVEGTDITIPVFNFNETHQIPNNLVTAAYKMILFNLTGKVNNDTWKGFAKGEVLFLGANGTQSGKRHWEISYNFAASPNVTGLRLGEITGIAKEGWDYLWTQFTEDEDSAAHVLIKRPIAAYVEQVYPYGNFGSLGIGF
jgi:hypothetical protein